VAYVRPVYPRRPGTDRKPIGYEVRYRDADGLQRTKGGFRRKRDADAYAVEVESNRQQGVVIPHSFGGVPLGEVADAWLTSIQGRRKPKTVEGYRMLLDSHVRPAFGARPIGAIAYADVDRFVRSIEAKGRQPGTVRNAFFVLKMVLDFAIKDGRIRGNPCAGVELPSPRSPEMLFLSAPEVRVLAAAVDRRWSQGRRRAGQPLAPPYGLLIEFAAFTGLRAGEIAALRVASLDLRAGTVHVARSASTVKGKLIEGEPKTRAGRRTVFVNRALSERLRAHLGDRLLDRSGYVFAKLDGGPLTYGTFYSEHFKPTVRAVLPERLHGLRFHVSAIPSPASSWSRAPTPRRWPS